MKSLPEAIASIPATVLQAAETLHKGGFEAYLVGGCVRDVLRETKPKDWDIATNATPEQIQGLFPHTFYENKFGTVGVVNDGEEDETLKTIEITTYRTESTYSDNRRPDEVAFSQDIEEDLKRRDFTINAIALDPIKGQVVDPHKGQEDLATGLLRAVGAASERFQEDALRMLRAVRIATQLGFAIEGETLRAISENRALLGKISKERIRDEFVKILMTERPKEGFELCHKAGILSYVAPDLERGIGVDQNQAHKFDVYEHNLRTLQHAADKGWSMEVRLASLMHDISKPETRRWSEEKKDWTFHGHEVVGARVTKKFLEYLHFPNKTIDKVTSLVRWHMFFSDPEKITLSAIRRIVRNIGEENIWDLMNLRVCDRIGTGRPKENPYRFRKYKSMVEEVLRDPISVGMLAINGSDLMQELGIAPGPRIGHMLHALLEEVLNDPTLNTREKLLEMAKNLNILTDTELKKRGESGKGKKEALESENIQEIRSKYGVS
ncbi:MAG TPA: HD domain-containing protein [Candidatus Paceibacterota bacterium]|nr:HD domain-containing protein [Candidatus Paceibacterota bacterium]